MTPNPLKEIERMKSQRQSLNADQRGLILMVRDIQDRCNNDLQDMDGEWREKFLDATEKLVDLLRAQIEYINALVADLEEKFRDLPPEVLEYLKFLEEVGIHDLDEVDAIIAAYEAGEGNYFDRYFEDGDDEDNDDEDDDDFEDGIYEDEDDDTPSSYPGIALN